MPKMFSVRLLRVSGQLDVEIEADTESAAREVALAQTETAVFGEPSHRRVAVLAAKAAGAALSPHSDEAEHIRKRAERGE